MNLTMAQFAAMLPNCPVITAARWHEPMARMFVAYGVDQPLEVCALMATVAVETSELRNLVENMNYSAERLVQVWPSKFPTISSAMLYAHNPERLGNYIYADRLGNGHEESGDGFKYRGHGPISITGRGNVAHYAELLQVPQLIDKPELLCDPVLGSASACAFWWDKRIDDAANRADFRRVTYQVNGGYTDFARRESYWLRNRQILGC